MYKRQIVKELLANGNSKNASNQPVHREGYNEKVKKYAPHIGNTYYYSHKEQELNIDRTKTVMISKGIYRNLVKSSQTIKSTFNRHFTGMKINSTFVTKGGSLLIELSSKEDAEKVESEWRSDFFAERGKSTVCSTLEKLNRSILLKRVPTNLTEDFLIGEMSKKFSVTAVKRFVTRNQVQLQTVKIDFENREDIQECLKEGVRIGHELFRAEEYKPRRRIIQCYNCYAFGHVANLCPKRHQVCIHCSGKHNYETCPNTDDEPTCGNCCTKGHSIIDKECPIYQAITKEMGLTFKKPSFINRNV